MTDALRVLALDNEYITDPAQPSRNSALYRELAGRHGFDFVASVTPRLSRRQDIVNKALHVLPTRTLWRNRAGVNPRAFLGRTRAAQAVMDAHAGGFDLILQLYGLFAPGQAPPPPYAMYLDATVALSQRYYRRAVPMTARERRRYMQLETATYQAAAALLPMSRFVAASLVEDYGCDPARITVAGAGANLLAESLGERRWDRPVALFVGLDFARKGGQELLAAWEEVRSALPDAELWVAGPRKVSAERPGVSWVGHQDPDGVRRLYEQASVFVLPSRWDPFPHVLREAMGAGLPCVATRQAGMPEIVAHEQTGLLVEPGDVPGLAAALLRLLRDPQEGERFGRAGRAAVLDGMTWTHVADRVAPALREAVR